MNPLIYVLIGVALAAIAVTVYAFASAKEGFEDQEGFHRVAKPQSKKPGGRKRGRRTFAECATEGVDSRLRIYVSDSTG